jgi:hypothetical protein
MDVRLPYDAAQRTKYHIENMSFHIQLPTLPKTEARSACKGCRSAFICRRSHQFLPGFAIEQCRTGPPVAELLASVRCLPWIDNLHSFAKMNETKIPEFSSNPSLPPGQKLQFFVPLNDTLYWQGLCHLTFEAFPAGHILTLLTSRTASCHVNCCCDRSVYMTIS